MGEAFIWLWVLLCTCACSIWFSCDELQLSRVDECNGDISPIDQQHVVSE
jgi:hypothetical protein